MQIGTGALVIAVGAEFGVCTSLISVITFCSILTLLVEFDPSRYRRYECSNCRLLTLVNDVSACSIDSFKVLLQVAIPSTVGMDGYT